jgi:hypothetical protein
MHGYLQTFCIFRPLIHITSKKETMTNKLTLTVFAFLSFALFSCSSNNNNNNTNGMGLIKVSGIHDVVVGMTYGDSMSLTIEGTRSIDENVALTITGLPSGVTANVSPSSGVPTFASFVRFTNMSAIPGSYDCQLTCTGTKSGKKSYDFNVTVHGAPVCGLLTTYNGTSNCGANFTDDITAVVTNTEANINDIRFANFGGRGFAVTGQSNCNNKTIIIPYQSINSTTSISGEGTFTSTGSIQINYIITVSGVSTSCWFTLQRYNL